MSKTVKHLLGLLIALLLIVGMLFGLKACGNKLNLPNFGEMRQVINKDVFHVVPFKYDIFDIEAFRQNTMEFIVVCTDVLTGKAIYHAMDHVDYDELEWLRASASMPIVSKVVEVQGNKLLDGGVSDSIPLEYFESIGYDRNIVILTQPLGYQKEHNRLMPLIRLSLRKFPEMIRALDNRHLMYNRQLQYVALSCYPPRR